MSVTLIKDTFEHIGLAARLSAPNQKIDLVIADPPDNNKTKYNGYTDSLSEGEYECKMSQWLNMCCGITTGPVWFTFNEKYIGLVESIIREDRLRLIQRCWWRWTFGQCQAMRYVPSLRPLYWLNNDTIYPDAIKVPSARATKYADKRAKKGGRNPDNVWDFSRICGTFKERRRWHPCQLPEKLLTRIILGHSLAEETIFDPFIGSGGTAYCAAALGRSCVGIDQSQEYLDNISDELKRRGHDHQCLY